MAKVLQDLIHLREEVGMTSEQIARVMDLNPSYVRQIEAGIRDVPRRFVARYVDAIERLQDSRNQLIREALGITRPPAVPAVAEPPAEYAAETPPAPQTENTSANNGC